MEKRESGGGQWQQCARSRFACLTVEGLQPKQDYEFRVSAENKHGVSQPCEPCGPVSIPEARRRSPNYDGSTSLLRATSGATAGGLGIPSLVHSRSTTGVSLLAHSSSSSRLYGSYGPGSQYLSVRQHESRRLSSSSSTSATRLYLSPSRG